MTHEEKMELLIRAIGYIDCISDLEDMNILNREQRDQIYNLYRIKFREIFKHE